ncbi:UNVERIFIED_CONTAM: hypothetical protein HDU68_001764, partial [Siphonaria sp. JEL0065]
MSNKAERGGGRYLRITSDIYGWNTPQTNLVPTYTTNYFDNTQPNPNLQQDLILKPSPYKPIALCGDNYLFLCTPNLFTDETAISTTSNVKDVFAKVFLTDLPGTVLFNQFD